MRFSIVIASYGRERWRVLGDTRALPSAQQQGADEVIRVHDPEGRVATSRNSGAAQATGDYLIFLDADDELASGYVDAMRQALEQEALEAEQLLLAPATSYTRGTRHGPSKFWPECNIRDGNWLVIGTGVPRSLWEAVGGFDDRADFGAFEDWAFWIKCIKTGARPVKVPNAVYVAHVTNHSRHRNGHLTVRLGWHYAVGREYFPEVYDESWLLRYGANAQRRVLAQQSRPQRHV